MKTAKLIIGIILLIVGIALYLLKTINPWISLVIGVVGLLCVIFSFFCKGCCKKKNLPAVSEAPAEAAAPEAEAEAPVKPVEVAHQDTEETPPTA